MADNATRQIMVRPWYTAPAIPETTVRDVFGAVAPDPRVVFIVQTFEYWLKGGGVPRLLRAKMLEVLPGNITQNNSPYLVSMLAKRGVAAEFFDLTSQSLDSNGSLRLLLESNGITLDTIRQYASWNGINPFAFFNGFATGVAESFASILFDIVDFIKLLRRVLVSQVRTILLLTTDPAAGLQSIWDQINFIKNVSEEIINRIINIDPTKLPEAIINVWRDWNSEFERHLDNLDPFSAGRLLGNICGQLWQLLTAILALVKLLRIAGRLVLRYASLFFGSVRKVAAEAKIVLADLASALRTIGRQIVDKLPQMGLATLQLLFPPRLLRQLVEQGRTLLTHGELALMPIFDEQYALAFAGGRMRAPFAAMISENGEPWAIATMSDRLPDLSQLFLS